MPLGRYFIFTGSLLLALLFLTDWYLPPLAVTPARGEVDRTIVGSPGTELEFAL